MTGEPSPDKYNDMKIKFGAYAQVYENNDPTNTMKTRSSNGSDRPDADWKRTGWWVQFYVANHWAEIMVAPTMGRPPHA